MRQQGVGVAGWLPLEKLPLKTVLGVVTGKRLVERLTACGARRQINYVAEIN